MPTVAEIFETARTAFTALGCGVTVRYRNMVCNGVGQATANMRMEEIGGQIRPVKTRRARFLVSDFRNAPPVLGDILEVVSGGRSTPCEIMFAELGESGNTIIIEWKESL